MAPKHIHQYQRQTLGKKKYPIYRCIKPSCTHYLSEELIVGKLSLCNRCKKDTVIIQKERDGSIRHKPHCAKCTEEPRNPKLRSSAKRKPETDAQALAKLLLGNIQSD